MQEGWGGGREVEGGTVKSEVEAEIGRDKERAGV